MRSLTRGLLVLLVCAAAMTAPPALAQERITSFASDITVNADSTMVVRETISVVCQQERIMHGIYRDFPTSYRDRYGNRVLVDFNVQSLTRDGADEPYHTENQSNGVRIYFGSADRLLPVGPHTYVLTYKASRELGFFKDHDELYWNVTGNGWDFEIEQAKATVTLPSGIPASSIKVDGWTGTQGSTQKNLRAYIDDSGHPSFATTAPLYSTEGLTIAVAWPKGAVAAPSAAMRAQWFLHDNRSSLICLVGLIIVLVYFLVAQVRVGTDPAKGAIVPQWDPPDGFSPAALRYIRCMGADNKAMSAALIDAAVKGAITIEEDGGKYTINRKAQVALPDEESELVELLLGSTPSIQLDQSNNAAIRLAIGRFKESLDKQFGSGYFATHIGYTFLGILLSALTLFLAFRSDPDGGIIPVVVCGVILLGLCIVFGKLLTAFTVKGRQLMDLAEGLRLYMRVAEEERLNVLNPPDKTPKLFEKLLPYALALGVEQQWSQQFAGVLAKAQAEGYHPGWYVGPGFYTGSYVGFASSLGGSFAHAISSSANPPGSSSGFGGGGGGGGFSGGGGGGGGGGGW